MRNLSNIHIVCKRDNSLLIFFLLYYLGVFLDIGTTYLGSPDLKKELNAVILYFKLGYKEIIITCALYLTVVTIVLLKLKRHILKSAKNNLSIKLFNLIFFFTSCHLVNSYLVSVNNFLGFCYYRSSIELLKAIGFSYAKFVDRIPYFYFYQFAFSCFLAVLLCFILLKPSKS